MRGETAFRTFVLGLAATAAGCAAGVPVKDAREPSPPSAAPVAEKTAADKAYDAVWAIYRRPTPPGTPEKSRAEYEFRDRTMQEFLKAARAFDAQYPNDPRRYEAWVQSSFTRPWFIAGFKPEFDQAPGEKNLIVDQTALKAFLENQVKLLAQVVEAPDATTRQRGGGFQALMIDSRTLARMNGTTSDIETFQPLVDRVAARLGDERAMPVVSQYLAQLRQKDAAKAQAYEARLKTNPTFAKALAAEEEKRKAAAVKADAAAKLLAAEIGTLKFTAADGREVDLAKMRGKVVLVDFWATWCGPCVAELPNVKKVYDAYHSQGFEVVGITLERADTSKDDTPAQVAQKREVAKQKMFEFVAKRQMPWPQHFDGLYFDTPLAKRYGINAIPAMFLLDKQGKVATSQARGEKLEPEVKRLLGQ